MDYVQILKESFRIFRSTKLILVFGFISLLPQLFSKLESENLFLVCIYLLVGLATVLVSVIASGGLIYSIYQRNLNKSLSFSEVWLQGRGKLFRNIGFFLLISPALLVAVPIYWIFAYNVPSSPFRWLLDIIFAAFFSPLITFGLCAIMIDDVKAAAAAWTSFLITINNFFRVFIIYVGVYIIRLLVIGLLIAILASGLFGFELPVPLSFDYSAYQKIVALPLIAAAGWLIDLIIFPLSWTILTLCYLIFTKEIQYPALSNLSRLN